MMPCARNDLLQEIAAVRELFPDWRFGQLVANLVTAAGATDPGAIWDIEDEQLHCAARRLVERNAARGAPRS